MHVYEPPALAALYCIAMYPLADQPDWKAAFAQTYAELLATQEELGKASNGAAVAELFALVRDRADSDSNIECDEYGKWKLWIGKQCRYVTGHSLSELRKALADHLDAMCPVVDPITGEP